MVALTDIAKDLGVALVADDLVGSEQALVASLGHDLKLAHLFVSFAIVERHGGGGEGYLRAADFSRMRCAMPLATRNAPSA